MGIILNGLFKQKMLTFKDMEMVTNFGKMMVKDQAVGSIIYPYLYIGLFSQLAQKLTNIFFKSKIRIFKKLEVDIYTWKKIGVKAFHLLGYGLKQVIIKMVLLYMQLVDLCLH
jgi:hypothetical protein